MKTSSQILTIDRGGDTWKRTEERLVPRRGYDGEVREFQEPWQNPNLRCTVDQILRGKTRLVEVPAFGDYRVFVDPIVSRDELSERISISGLLGAKEAEACLEGVATNTYYIRVTGGECEMHVTRQKHDPICGIAAHSTAVPK